MLDITRSLPEDPAELRAFTALLRVEVMAQALLIQKLRHRLAGHRAHRFGASPKTSEQLQLALEMSEIAIATLTAKLDLPQDAPVDKPKRKPIPDHIPRIEDELTSGTEDCAQCGGKLRRLGEDVTEKPDYAPLSRFEGQPLPGNGSTSMPIIGRSIGKARYSSVRALIWIARPWRIGWGNPPLCWSHWLKPSDGMCWRGKRSLRMIPRPRCWHRELARPKQRGCGPTDGDERPRGKNIPPVTLAMMREPVAHNGSISVLVGS